jgi:hypothetical protein
MSNAFWNIGKGNVGARGLIAKRHPLFGKNIPNSSKLKVSEGRELIWNWNGLEY